MFNAEHAAAVQHTVLDDPMGARRIALSPSERLQLERLRARPLKVDLVQHTHTHTHTH
eukprot:COSAG03_NODE_2734_length_2490_cov_1739.109996_6_plen_57_part_01